jgi:predicted  nucleic acid-binding Zn-ribbon protein
MTISSVFHRCVILSITVLFLAPAPAFPQGDLMQGLTEDKDETAAPGEAAPELPGAMQAPAQTTGAGKAEPLTQAPALPSVPPAGGLDLQGLRQQLGEKDGVISTLQSDLVAKEDLVGSLQDQLREKDNLLRSLRGQLAAKESLLGKVQGQLREKESLLGSVKGQMGGLEEELGPMRDQLIALSTQAAEKDMQLIALKAQLAEKDATISELEAQNRLHAAATVEAKGKLKSEIERLAAIEASVAAAEERAAGFDKYYAEKDAAITSLEKQRLILGLLFAAALLASIFLWRRRPK